LDCSTSHTVGQFAGALVPGAGGAAGAAKLAGPGSRLLGQGSRLFGRGSKFGHKGIFNRGPVRTGWGWQGSRTSGRDVFRTSWSRPGNRSGANHLDFDNLGLGTQGGLALGSFIWDDNESGEDCD